jgi:hypothetical protein
MDAAIPVDAQNAPTRIWKTAQNAVSHSAHTHHRCNEEERRPKRRSLINLSTDSDQVHPKSGLIHVVTSKGCDVVEARRLRG